MLKLAMCNLQNTLREGTFLKHQTIAADERTSERGGAPVNRDKLVLHAYFFKPSCA
jgi:hypothetical protein